MVLILFRLVLVLYLGLFLVENVVFISGCRINWLVSSSLYFILIVVVIWLFLLM